MIIPTATPSTNLKDHNLDLSQTNKHQSSLLLNDMNVWMVETDITKRIRYFLHALYAISNGEFEVRANHFLVATQFKKLEKLEQEYQLKKLSDKPADYNKVVLSLVDACYEFEEQSGIKLIEYIPGYTNPENEDKQPSIFRLLFLKYVYQAYELGQKYIAIHNGNVLNAHQAACREVSDLAKKQAQIPQQSSQTPAQAKRQRRKLQQKWSKLKPPTENTVMGYIDESLQSGWTLEEIKVHLDNLMERAFNLTQTATKYLSKKSKMFEPTVQNMTREGGNYGDTSTQNYPQNFQDFPLPETSSEEPNLEKKLFERDCSGLQYYSSNTYKKESYEKSENEINLISQKKEKISEEVEEAVLAIESLMEAGQNSFEFVMTDEQKKYRKNQKNLSPEKLINQLPQLLEEADCKDWNLIIRPRRVEEKLPPGGLGLDPQANHRKSAVIQLDDLDEDRMALFYDYSFKTIMTSKGNYQCWLEVEGVSGKTAGRLKVQLIECHDADDGANGAVRLAGSRNVKPKHKQEDGSYPLIRLVKVNKGKKVTIQELKENGLLFTPKKVKEKTARREEIEIESGRKGTPPRVMLSSEGRKREWPSYERALSEARRKKNGEVDRSSADMRWCCVALGMGWGKEEVVQELLRVSLKLKAKKKGGLKYAEDTVNKAWDWIN